MLPLRQPGGNRDREVARRDQRHFAGASELDFGGADLGAGLNKGFACHAPKPHWISRVDSCTRAFQLGRPATTSIRRRPFCSAEPVKP